jgi:predicted Zn-dependent protease DUF2268
MIHFRNNAELPTSLSQTLQRNLLAWESELRILISMPPVLTVEFNNDFVIQQTGTGGHADLRENKLYIAYDPKFKGNKNEQLHNLKGSFYHEAYHLAQGDVDWAHLSAIDEAILEGSATVFEQLKAGSSPLWGKLPDKSTVVEWYNLVTSLPAKYDRNKWKFYNEELREPWILYRVGVFIIREALNKDKKLTIEELATMSAERILRLAILE